MLHQIHQNATGARFDCSTIVAVDTDANAEVTDVDNVQVNGTSAEPVANVRWPMNTLGSQPTLREDKKNKSRGQESDALWTRTALYWWDFEQKCMRIGLLQVPELLSGNHATFTVEILTRFFMSARTQEPTGTEVYTTVTAHGVKESGPTQWVATGNAVLVNVPAAAVDFSCDIWQDTTRRANQTVEF
jgi:hypothetical protein